MPHSREEYVKVICAVVIGAPTADTKCIIKRASELLQELDQELVSRFNGVWFNG